MRSGLVTMVFSLVVLAGLLGQEHADSTGISREGGSFVPAEEYPVFDRVVESRFLTSATRAVVIERLTAIRLHPDAAFPPTRRWFDEAQFFEGRLRSDLIRDFIAKCQEPSRLEARFQFGVNVRFVTPDGFAEPEVRHHSWRVPGPRSMPAQNLPGPAGATVDRLAFSRAAFNARADEALVYVSNERPDGTGAGFLIWLHRGHGPWTIVDTETLWVARSDAGAPGSSD